MNISFLTSGHLPFDDRIFWHMGKSLSDVGNNIQIISSKSAENTISEGITINCFEGDNLSKIAKKERFIEYLFSFSPEIIICSEPLPVIAAHQYRKRARKAIKIIYDITEWYPSRKNLSPYKIPEKWLVFVKLLFFNFTASFISDAFIFGESYKSRPYRILFPFKPYKFVTYYPDPDYFEMSEPHPPGRNLNLAYTGRISIEKGFGNFMESLDYICEHHKDIVINLQIVGWYETEEERVRCESILGDRNRNISIEIKGRQNFPEFIAAIRESDLFMDLRERNFESDRSLPIRLFCYAALGRPVLFTDLMSIRKDVDIEKFGFLVNPHDSARIEGIVSEYIRNPGMYLDHCMNARKLAEEKYSWKLIATEFTDFIQSFSDR